MVRSIRRGVAGVAVTMRAAASSRTLTRANGLEDDIVKLEGVPAAREAAARRRVQGSRWAAADQFFGRAGGSGRVTGHTGWRGRPLHTHLTLSSCRPGATVAYQVGVTRGSSRRRAPGTGLNLARERADAGSRRPPYLLQAVGQAAAGRAGCTAQCAGPDSLVHQSCWPMGGGMRTQRTPGDVLLGGMGHRRLPAAVDCKGRGGALALHTAHALPSTAPPRGGTR